MRMRVGRHASDSASAPQDHRRRARDAFTARVGKVGLPNSRMPWIHTALGDASTREEKACTSRCRRMRRCTRQRLRGLSGLGPVAQCIDPETAPGTPTNSGERRDTPVIKTLAHPSIPAQRSNGSRKVRRPAMRASAGRAAGSTRARSGSARGCPTCSSTRPVCRFAAARSRIGDLPARSATGVGQLSARAAVRDLSTRARRPGITSRGIRHRAACETRERDHDQAEA